MSSSELSGESRSELIGEWVEVRPTREADAGALFAALDDAEVWAHLTTARPETADDMLQVVRQYRAAMQPWTVFLRRDVNECSAGTVVGWSSYLDTSEPNARLEVGSTAYSRAVWGSVVNAEVKLLLLGHAFDELGVGRVQLKTDLRNERSQAAIERLGATREGVLRSFQRRVDGTMRDTVVYSVVAAEWPDVRAGLIERLATSRG